VRRKTHSERGVHIIAEDRVTAVLAEADHIVNLLPDNEATRNYVNARRLGACKPGARFYNIGRGTTVDERALNPVAGERTLRRGLPRRVCRGAVVRVESAMDDAELFRHAAHGGRTQRSGRGVGETLPRELRGVC
jgi:hypothetical protein